MKSQVWRRAVGLFYIFLVATIWTAASFVVQFVVDGGVSTFLDKYGSIFFWLHKNGGNPQELGTLENVILLGDKDAADQTHNVSTGAVLQQEVGHHEAEAMLERGTNALNANNAGMDAKGRWTRSRVARVSLLICPFWFLAQLTFNLSLKYTTVTSNTILSSASSLFTFVVALVFLGEKFTWVKLISVLLCMGGTIIVSLGDSQTGLSLVASNPALGDFMALLSSGFYAAYITLIRKMLPDEDDAERGRASMAQFLGYVGAFNFLIFLPVALFLDFAKLEHFNMLTWMQVGLIVGKDTICGEKEDRAKRFYSLR